MSVDQGHMQAETPHQRQSQVETHLQGGWLVSARVAWVVVLIVTVGLFISSIPYTFADAQTICASAACSNSSYLTPDQARELQRLGLSMDFYAILITTWTIILEFIYVATGVVIFWRRSDDRVAFISSLALVTFGAAFRGFNPEASLSPLLFVLSVGLAFFGNCCFGLFFSLFPTGRFVPRWTGLLALGWIVYWGINNLILARILTNSSLDFAILLGLLVSIVVTQVYRYRQVSTPLERQQTKWVVFGISLALLGVFTLFTMSEIASLDIIPDLIAGSLLYVFLLLIPLSIGIAILRSHLWDIDILINRTLVYGTLTACVVALYVLVVVGLGVLLQSSGNLLISLLATSLVAVLFQPLRERLQRAVNRLMYGERDDPYAVLSGLGQRMEATLAPEEVLPTIVETVAQALKLPYAAISLQHDNAFAVVASYGKPIDQPLVLSLAYQGEIVGQLLLSPRAPGEAFSLGDRRLLDELARHTGLAAHAVQLSGDLQRSRERLVTAREEERRRLRRDLHDGLGSALTSVMFKLDATDELLDRDLVNARALLTEVRAQTQASIDDIRRLVYNLRPPILDEWGLVAALREYVAQYNLKNVRVSIDAPLSLPPLPAAVEVAVYRIVLEALANVIKHAQATTCTIRLHLMDDALTVEVQDDGLGRRASCHAGVGMTAMRERAEELGGWCVVEDAAPYGTRVFARVPLRKE